MKKTIIVATLVVLLLIFLSALVKSVHSSNKSLSYISRESEKTPEQVITEFQNELSGLNGGPRPSGFVEPTITGVDSIPIN